MNPVGALVALLVCLPLAVGVMASGPVGIFAVVERVVFEPNEQSPERIRVWGAFSFAEGGVEGASTMSAPVRGYPYFRMPTPAEVLHQTVQAVRNEWSDFKAVAGSGQAIAFGEYAGRYSATGPSQVWVTVRIAEGGFFGLPL